MESLFKEKIWADLQKQKEEGELTEFFFKNDLGAVKYRFFKRIAGECDCTQYFDIASYRGAEGPYIEEVVNGKSEELLGAFLKDFGSFCAHNNIIAEFAKLDPWDTYAKTTRDVLHAESYGNYYCNDLSRDFYLLDYNRRAKRSIRKAKDSGVEVKVDYSGKTIPEFVRLYRNTEEKYHTGEYYIFSENDMIEYFNLLKGKCFLINAVLNKKIITSVFVAYGHDVMHYLYLGNDPEYLAYQGNSLLTYETALLGQKKGLKIFDMGGGKPGGNIEMFKRNFISDDCVWEYYAVKKIWNDTIYNKILSTKNEIKNQKMFPLYRG